MKITEYGSVRSASDAKRAARKGAAGSVSFADFLTQAQSAEESAGVEDIAPASSVSVMLALQEISEEDVRRKKLVQKGKGLLAALETLRQQLLKGEVPLPTLRHLSLQLAVQREQVADPKLIALIDDIELRAAVELAKLEMAARRLGDQGGF